MKRGLSWPYKALGKDDANIFVSFAHNPDLNLRHLPIVTVAQGGAARIAKCGTLLVPIGIFANLFQALSFISRIIVTQKCETARHFMPASHH